MIENRLQRGTLVGFLIAVSLLFFWVVRPFIITLVMAAIFTALAFPLYERLERLFRGRKAAASALTLLIVIFVVILPLLGLLGIVANQAIKVSSTLGPWIRENLVDRADVVDLLEGIPGYAAIEPYRTEIFERLGTVVSRFGNFLVSQISTITAGTLTALLHFAILGYTMFFFFMDGSGILRRILYLIPLSHDDEVRILDRFRSVSRATIKGTLIIAIVQGGGAGLSLWAAGIPSALFWTALMTVLSIIPNVGSGLVWLPAAVLLIVNGAWVKGVLVIVWCGLVVGSADNVLRPILVGKDTKMHELLILLSTIGGLFVFGLSGFILGPVIAALFVTLWDIYAVTFKERLPDVGERLRPRS